MNRIAIICAVIVVSAGLLTTACATGAESESEPELAPMFDLSGDDYRQRSQQLAVHLPAETQILLKIDPLRAEEYIGEAETYLDESGLPSLGQGLVSLGDFDSEQAAGPIHLALSPLAPAAFWDSFHLMVPPTVDDLPVGWHLRAILPQGYQHVVEEACDGDEGARWCEHLVRSEPHDDFFLIDILVGDDDVNSRRQWAIWQEQVDEIDSYQPPRSPAFRRYLLGDDALALYAETDRLRRHATLVEVAKFKEQLDSGGYHDFPGVIPRLMSDWLKSYRAGFPPAFVTDITAAIGNDDAGALRVDTVQTYSERGQQKYSPAASSAYDGKMLVFEEPFLEAVWVFDEQRDLDAEHSGEQGDRSRYATDPRQQLQDLREGDLMAYINWLESPHQLRRHLTHHLAENIDDELKRRSDSPRDSWPTPQQLADVDRLAISADSYSGDSYSGEDADLELRFGVVLEWDEPVWVEQAVAAEVFDDYSDHLVAELGDRGLELSFDIDLETTDDGGQRVIVTLNADDQELEYPDQRLTYEPHGFVRIDTRSEDLQNIDAFEPLVQTLGDSQFHYAGVDTESHRLRRMNLGAELSPELSPIAVGDYTPPTTSASSPECMRSFRREHIDENMSTMPRMSPRNRVMVLERMLEDVQERSRDCIDEDPENAEFFERYYRRWVGYKAHYFAHHFHYIRALPLLDRACELGDTTSCATRERVENIDGFQRPVQSTARLSSRSGAPKFVAARGGLYLEGERIVSSDEFRENPDEYADRLVEIAGEYGDDEPVIQLVVDAMVDARFVAQLTEAIDQEIWLVIEQHPLETSQFPIDGDGDSEVEVHVSTGGFDVRVQGRQLPAIDGCSEDGPTVCITDGDEYDAQFIDSATTRWYDGVDNSDELIAGVVERYPAHRLYEVLVDVDDELDTNRLTISSEAGLPVQLAVRAADALRYRREENSFDDDDDFKGASIEVTFVRGVDTTVGMFDDVNFAAP